MTQIRSMDELKDLSKAVYLGETVNKKDHGIWCFNSECHIVLTNSSSDIKNWHYFEENEEPKQLKDPEFGVVYQSKSEPTCRAVIQWRQKFKDDAEASYGIIGSHYTLEQFWKQWEEAE